MTKNTSPAPGSRPDQTRQIGRGGLYLTATKLYFIVSSYVIYFGLPQLGGDALFGDFKAVGAWLSVIATVLVTGTVQAVSRFVTHEPDAARCIKRRAIKLQLGFGLLVAASYFFAAPLVAKGHEDLLTAMRVSAAIPLIYAVYSVLMGTLNGEKRFAEQAAMDAVFTTLKIGLVLLCVAIFRTTASAYAGFAAAAGLVFLTTAYVTHRGHTGQLAEVVSAPSAATMFRFQIQTVGFMLCVQWIVQMDLWYTLWFQDLPSEALKDASKSLYGATQLFSQISYSIVTALTFVLFPLISASTLAGDGRAAAGYVREALRYALIMVVPVAAAFTAAPGQSLNLQLKGAKELFEVLPGQSDALRYLGLGYVFFSLFFILCSVLNASGRPRASIGLALGVLGVQAGLGALLLPRLGLVGQAVAGLSAMLLGFVGAVLLLQSRVGSILPWRSLARILVAGGVAYAVGFFWHPDGKLITLVRIGATGVLFLVLLVVLREFTAADREKFAKILSRRRTT